MSPKDLPLHETGLGLFNSGCKRFISTCSFQQEELIPFPLLSKPRLLSLPTMNSKVPSSYQRFMPLFKVRIVVINFQENKG